MNAIRAIVLSGVSQLVITTAFAAPDNAVIRANAAAGVAAIQACIAPLSNPFHESRAYAMMHLAIHDALNAIDRKYQPYAYDTKAEPGTSADAAVAAAAYYVMSPSIQKLPAEALPNDGCVKNGIAVVEAAYVLALAVIPDGPAKTRGIALGKRPVYQQDMSSGWPARRLSMHTGAPLRRLREMGERHPLRDAGHYPIPARPAVQGGRCEVQG